MSSSSVVCFQEMEPDIINHCTLYLHGCMLSLLSPKITLTLSTVSKSPGALFVLVGFSQAYANKKGWYTHELPCGL